MEFNDLTATPKQLQAILVSMGLAQPGEKPIVTPLAGGVSSGIYRIELASGAYCLKQALPQLKVKKEWLVPVERVFAEIDWLKTVATVVPKNVPKVLGTDRASKSFVMEYLAEPFVNWKTELLAGRVAPEVAASVGDVLGRIHAATANDEDLAKRFDNDANFYAIRLEPYLVETASNHPDLWPALDALVKRTQSIHRVLVHGDVSPKNILIGPDGPVLLDAECATYGDPAFDMAFCLNHLLLKAAWLTDSRRELFDSYRGLIASYFAQVDFEPREALEKRVGHLLPALTLARIDGKSPVEYLDEPMRLKIRTATIPLIMQPLSNLEDIALYWKKEFSA